MNRVQVLMASLLASAMSVGALAQTASPPREVPAGTPAADNSSNNDQKRAGARPTADDQSNSKSDVEVTQRIRRSVMDDEKLSVYGQNVKIVTSAGKVTLNGVVRTAEEKKQIGIKASAVAGAGQVMNELKVAPAN